MMMFYEDSIKYKRSLLFGCVQAAPLRVNVFPRRLLLSEIYGKF